MDPSFHLAVCLECSRRAAVRRAISVPAHMCTSDGGNYSPTDKKSDKVRRVCVYFLNCLIHQVELKPGNRHPSALHHTQKQTLVRCENLSTRFRAFTFSADPCRSEPGPVRNASSPHSGHRSTRTKSHVSVLTACDGAENIFPSL